MLICHELGHNNLINSVAYTSNDVPQVESFVSLDALVGNLACVVNTERETDQSEADGHQQEEDHHHVKSTVQCSYELWEN